MKKLTVFAGTIRGGEQEAGAPRAARPPSRAASCGTCWPWPKSMMRATSCSPRQGKGATMRHNSSAPAPRTRGHVQRPNPFLVQCITARPVRCIAAGRWWATYRACSARGSGSRHAARACWMASTAWGQTPGAGRVEVYDTEDHPRLAWTASGQGRPHRPGRGPQLALLLKEWRAIRRYPRRPRAVLAVQRRGVAAPWTIAGASR